MNRRVLTKVLLVVIGVSSANAISCYSCTGKACLNGADIGEQKLCNGADDSCYSKFSGFVPIQRGCLSEVDSCGDGDCETCQSDFCNVYSAKQHKCVTCSSVTDSKCLSDPSSLAVAQCGATSVDVSGAQCYSRVIGRVTERGCVQSQSDLDTCDGLATLCSICTGEGCNSEEIPAGRQKCVQCDSSTLPTCNDYTVTSYCDLPDESCVTSHRTDGSYLKNCESSMAEVDRQSCLTNPSSCVYCSKYECNKVQFNAQTGRQCYTCQGTDCLRSSVTIETCHDVDDQCFTQFDGFNPVRRGCRAALSTADKAICDDADDVDCSTCIGDFCNLSGREDHQCAYCSSVLDENCVTATGPFTVVQCPAPSTEISADAQCYTRIVGGVTERGCLGSATDAEECRSSTSCQVCAIENGVPCNERLFPADRRKCVVGSLADQYCPNPWDECVQIFNGGVYTKQCQSSMSAEEVSFCRANSNKCYSCAADNCNQEDQAFDYVECLSCDSHDNPACATNPSSITAIEYCDSCVTLLSNDTSGVQRLQRTCLSTLPPEEAELCSSTASGTDPDVMCKSCTENRCNTGVYPEDRLACYSCLEGSCFSHDSIVLEYCPFYQPNDVCVAQMDSSGVVMKMGCRSSLSAGEVASCGADPTRCHTCDTAGCNDPVKYWNRGSCVQCNSALDVGCVGRAVDMDAEPCNDPLNSKCFTQLVDGTTVRGCVSDLDSSAKTRCAQGINCTTCDSSTKCNVDIYPADRLSCFTCLQPPCNSHESISLEVCPKYSTTDSCMLLTDSTGQLIRMGCDSTLSSTEQSTCKSNPQLCKTCTSPKCNDPATLLGTGKCIKCSSAYQSDCMTMTSSFESEPCNDPQNTQCYSRFVDNKITERGCLSDLDTTSKNQCLQGNNCVLCSSRFDSCNSLEYPMGQIKCFQCDSTTQSSCKSAQTGTPETCPSYNTANQCYIVVKSNGDTVRKCSTASREQECAGSARCEVCLFSGCNARESTAVMSTDATKVNTTTTEAPPKPCRAGRGSVLSLVAATLMMIVFAAERFGAIIA